MNTQEFIAGFVKNTLGKKTKHDRWSVINWGLMDTLVYTYPKIERHWNYDKRENDIAITYDIEHIAYRLQDGSVLFNANELRHAGKKFAYGNELRLWGNESDPQIYLRNAGAIPLPFTLFHETNTDARDFSWIVKPVPEKVTEKIIARGSWEKDRLNVRHFSGACIFAIDKDTYLFDLDRQEIEQHNIFNPFVTKLPDRVNSIKEAYNLLIPDDVKKALSNGKEVLRQGEFFFIKYSDVCPIKPDLTDEEIHILKYPPSRLGFGIPTGRLSFADDDRSPYDPDSYKGSLKGPIDTPEKEEFQNAALRYKEIFDKYHNAVAIPGKLGKSSTGSHNVDKYIKDGDMVYVSGTVKQQRREHADLILNGWYTVSPNTGVISWTITGNID